VTLPETSTAVFSLAWVTRAGKFPRTLCYGSRWAKPPIQPFSTRPSIIATRKAISPHHPLGVLPPVVFPPPACDAPPLVHSLSVDAVPLVVGPTPGSSAEEDGQVTPVFFPPLRTVTLIIPSLKTYFFRIAGFLLPTSLVLESRPPRPNLVTPNRVGMLPPPPRPASSPLRLVRTYIWSTFNMSSTYFFSSGNCSFVRWACARPAIKGAAV